MEGGFEPMLTEPVKATVREITSTEQARSPIVMIQTEKGGSGPENTRDLSPDALKELTENLQAGLRMIHDVDLNFSIHESSGRIMVTVKEASTGQVIREIPPRELLNLAAKLDEMMGLIFDERG
jgi:flagellar protein FlaG